MSELLLSWILASTLTRHPIKVEKLAKCFQGCHSEVFLNNTTVYGLDRNPCIKSCIQTGATDTKELIKKYATTGGRQEMDDTKKKEVIAKLPVDNSGKSGMVLANIDGKWVWVTIEE